MKEEKRYGYDRLMRETEALARRYGAVRITELAKSVFGRPIPLIRLGNGPRTLLYVGAHHGMESVTSGVLMRFCEEVAAAAADGDGGRLFGLSVPYLLRTRTVWVVPMLNPDGVTLSVEGPPDEEEKRAPLLAMNGGSADFTHWQANGRGVDLNHNYDAGFEEYRAVEASLGLFGGAAGKWAGDAPESEPETAALCGLIRSRPPELLLTLHTQGEEIYWRYGGRQPPRAAMLTHQIARLTGYRPASAEGTAAYGGLKDWFIAAFDRPGFTLECGRGVNPLPPSAEGEIYARLREMLITLPSLI